MPVYVLNPGGEVPLERQPLRCEITLPSGLAGAQLTATVAGSPATSALDYGRKDLLVLADITAETTLSITPGPGLSEFSAGTVAQLCIFGAPRPGSEPDRVNLSPLDVSGLSSVELLRIAPTERGIVASAVTRTVARKLTTLGNAARVACGTLLGQAGASGVPDTRISVVLDSSASFRSLVDDDSMGAVVDALTGIADVCAHDFPLTYAIPGLPPRQVSDLEAAGAELQQGLRAAARTTLFDPTEAIGALRFLRGSATGRHVTYVLTDDLGVALLDHLGPDVRPVLLSAPHSAALQRTTSEAVRSGVVTVIDPVAAPLPLRERLLADPVALQAVVRDLIAPIRSMSALAPEGTHS